MVSEKGRATIKALTSAAECVTAIVSGSTSKSSVLPCVSLVGCAREMEGGTTSSTGKVVALALLKTPTLRA